MCENTKKVNCDLKPIQPYRDENMDVSEFIESSVIVEAEDIKTNFRLEKTYCLDFQYMEDTLTAWRQMELKRRKTSFSTLQLHSRSILVEFLQKASANCALSRPTLHLAVYIVDIFLDNYIVRPDMVNLVAIACLIIASKAVGPDTAVPKFTQLRKLANNKYTSTNYKNTERSILRVLNFELWCPTVATFAEYYSTCMLPLDDFYLWHVNGTESCLYDVMTSLFKDANISPYNNELYFELVDLTLTYNKFTNEKPSLVAAACIAASRQILKMSPIWDEFLVKLTGYTDDEIQPFISIILQVYDISKVVKSVKSILSDTMLVTGALKPKDALPNSELNWEYFATMTNYFEQIPQELLQRAASVTMQNPSQNMDVDTAHSECSAQNDRTDVDRNFQYQNNTLGMVGNSLQIPITNYLKSGNISNGKSGHRHDQNAHQNKMLTNGVNITTHGKYIHPSLTYVYNDPDITPTVGSVNQSSLADAFKKFIFSQNLGKPVPTLDEITDDLVDILEEMKASTNISPTETDTNSVPGLKLDTPLRNGLLNSNFRFNITVTDTVTAQSGQCTNGQADKECSDEGSNSQNLSGLNLLLEAILLQTQQNNGD